MKILSSWLKKYVDHKAGFTELANELTLRGIAVENTELILDPDQSQDAVYEMDITTNRVDAMNHYGIAREVAVIYNLPLKQLDIALSAAKTAAVFPVRIEAPELCGRFTTRIIRNVTIGESKGKIAEYFDALEQKKILNAVDVSNFVLQGMGQPTHAFDLDKLEGGIVVRTARKGERLKLLDGTERTLLGDELVVADEKKALALAGVMGGWDSMITPATKNILVESAWFSPASIRRSSRRHLLHTDASHRFERGADFNAAPIGNALVCKLILEQCGGTLEGELIDIRVSEAEAKTANRAPIQLAVAEVKRHLGTTLAPEGLSEKLIAQYLTALGCKLSDVCNGTYLVTLPSWRLDLEREIDLIEEIARVYGYNKFANTLPTPGTVVALPNADKEDTVRTRMLALGFSETISSTFCSAADAVTFSANPAVAMDNPLSEEAGMLRPSLLPGMLAALAHNLNRDVNDLRLFETGNIFYGSTKVVTEELSLAFGSTQSSPAASSLHPANAAGFYEMKGAIEDLLAKFSGAVVFDRTVPAWLHPGRSARIVFEGTVIGYFGELHPAEAQKRKLKQTVCLGEINLNKLFANSLRQPVAQELSRYQAVERDFSFIFPDTIDWTQISQGIDKHIAHIQSVTPMEIFRDAKGKAVPAGHYSLLLRVVLQSKEGTLTEVDLKNISTAIIASANNLGGKLRS